MSSDTGGVKSPINRRAVEELAAELFLVVQEAYYKTVGETNGRIWAWREATATNRATHRAVARHVLAGFTRKPTKKGGKK